MQGDNERQADSRGEKSIELTVLHMFAGVLESMTALGKTLCVLIRIAGSSVQMGVKTLKPQTTNITTIQREFGLLFSSNSPDISFSYMSDLY